MISDVVPSPTTAGALLLHRHFSELNWIFITCASYCPKREDSLCDKYFHLNLPPLIERLRHTRLGPIVDTLMTGFGFLITPKQLRMEVLSNKYDAIVTVAQSREWIIAQRLAKEAKVPLITFFHDWWPGIQMRGRAATALLERRYRRLASESSVVFAISEEMQGHLGTPTNCIVLYPIPGLNAIDAPQGMKALPRRLVYAGTLYPIYGDRVVAFSESLKADPAFSFAFAGKFPPGCELLAQRASLTGYHEGFLKGEAFDSFMKSASAHLVVGSFDPHFRTFFETNFPSKLTEYAQYGRSLVLWAPEYASSVRWARRTAAALVVTDPDPRALISAVNRLFCNEPEQLRLGGKALEAARTIFNRNALQRIFEDSLRRVIRLPNPERVAVNLSDCVQN